MSHSHQRLADLAYKEICTSGALLTDDHFVYSSGRHGDTYIVHHEIYTNPERIHRLMAMLAQLIVLENPNLSIDTVMGPESGGILMSQGLAFSLGRSLQKTVHSVWGKKESGEFVKNFSLHASFEKYVINKSILLVDDFMTSGETFRILIALCKKYNGGVLGCSCLWNRGEVTPDQLYGVPIVSLIKQKLEDWDAITECPLCKKWLPVNTKFGHGKEFDEKQRRRLKMLAC